MLRTFQCPSPRIPGYHAVRWQRAFFNFSNFSPEDRIAHSASGTQSYHERKILPYRRSELYDVIADVESYSDFVPYCTGSRILRSNARQDGITVMEAELTVGFLAFQESYVSTVTCKPDEFVEAVASSSSPLFKTLTTAWHLQSAPSSSLPSPGPFSHDIPVKSVDSLARCDQGTTLVTLDLAFAFSNPMHATVSGTFFGQVSKLMVKAFERRCIALYGPRAG